MEANCSFCVSALGRWNKSVNRWCGMQGLGKLSDNANGQPMTVAPADYYDLFLHPSAPAYIARNYNKLRKCSICSHGRQVRESASEYTYSPTWWLLLLFHSLKHPTYTYINMIINVVCLMWMIFVILFVVTMNVFRAILFTFRNFNSFILHACTFSLRANNIQQPHRRAII